MPPDSVWNPAAFCCLHRARLHKRWQPSKGCDIMNAEEEGGGCMLDWLKRKFKEPTILYTRAQLEAVEKHVERCFGDLEETVQVSSVPGLQMEVVQTNREPEPKEHMVSHELKSPDLHLDIHWFAPQPKHWYYTLCTVGAGAHRMKAPAGMNEPARAEFVMQLPMEWETDNPSDRWQWPERVMRTAAREALNQKLFYCSGYTLDFIRSLGDGVSFTAVLMANASGVRKGARRCLLPGGEEVAFYMLIPIYPEELQFARTNSPSELVRRINAVGGGSCNPHRPNSCKNCAMRPLERLYSSGASRTKILNNRIDVDQIAAYQVPAIFLRWMIEHDMGGEEFLTWQDRTAEEIRRGEYAGDLREFVRDELGGMLMTGWFSEEGEAFAKWYFREGRMSQDHYRMADIDAYALEYFGSDRFYGEMKTEAYLFLPWNEETYQALAQRISAAFERWKNTR